MMQNLYESVEVLRGMLESLEINSKKSNNLGAKDLISARYYSYHEYIFLPWPSHFTSVVSK
jgi:hypothetical protein